MKKNKGFTLVELLAVIVILAIIMIIAIPAVLNTMQTAQRKTFGEFIQKVYNVGERKYIEDTSFNNITIYPNAVYIYSIKDDLGMNNTGDYAGYFYVHIDPSVTEYTMLVFNKDLGFQEKVYSSKEHIDLDKVIEDGVGNPNYVREYMGLTVDYDLYGMTKDKFMNGLKGYYKMKTCIDGYPSEWGRSLKIVDAANPSNIVENICD